LLTAIELRIDGIMLPADGSVADYKYHWQRLPLPQAGQPFFLR
jgi:hypothetical protein